MAFWWLHSAVDLNDDHMRCACLHNKKIANEKKNVIAVLLTQSIQTAHGSRVDAWPWRIARAKVSRGNQLWRAQVVQVFGISDVRAGGDFGLLIRCNSSTECRITVKF